MITKKTFKQKLDGKVWKAIQSMIDGVKRQSARPGFEIQMSMWGCTDGEICFGCAATSTVQEVCGHDFTPADLNGVNSNCEYLVGSGGATISEEYRGFTKQANALNMCDHDLGEFEFAIDMLRRGHGYYHGDIKTIFRYMGVEDQYVEPDTTLHELSTATWREDMPAYQKYANKLKKLDI